MSESQTPDNVADIATVRADLDRDGITLLGVFGSDADPEALIRLPDGHLARVRRGTRIGNEVVALIDADRIALSHRGYAHWIEMPGS